MYIGLEILVFFYGLNMVLIYLKLVIVYEKGIKMVKFIFKESEFCFFLKIKIDNKMKKMLRKSL